MIRDADGREHKPDDYLLAFTDFVQREGAAIEALSVLLQRPGAWNPETLTALRDALATAPGHFTETNLERAHRAKYSKALVDIISMVKHAAEESAPLMTAQERVDAAVAQVTSGRVLTEPQSAWMSLIAQHLVENLSIDRDDFNLIPILSSRGGWGRANAVFDHDLDRLITDLNEELAAA